jgi:AAA+ ATPase superfamily predicted ATPase
MLEKPAELFDHEREWASLAEFVIDDRPGATLAIVYGRRRQGKTLTLEFLCEQTGGLYFPGLQQAEPLTLNQLGRSYAAYQGLPARTGFENYDQAFEALLELGGGDHPVPLVLDEFSYLVAASPQLPSVLQNVLSPRSRALRRSRARLILCGSAFSVMSDLLAGSAALRGRATHEIVFRPFDYRASAHFWGIEDPAVAVRLHALCGGTPAYREYARGDAPRSVSDLDGRWVPSHLLNPASAFFREGRVLLAEEPSITGSVAYQSVLTALAAGRTRRSEIAAALGRPDSALAHPLTVLEDARLVIRQEDALRARRTTFHVAEPILRLHQTVIAPQEARLLRHQGARVWAEAGATVRAQIYGPHFEQLAREWTAAHASSETLGGMPTRVAPTTLHCRMHRAAHEVDVVAVHESTGHGTHVLALGEAKWGAHALDVDALRRLEHVADLLPDAAAAAPPRLLLFGAAGWTKRVATAAAGRPDVELIDLQRLYHGS